MLYARVVTKQVKGYGRAGSQTHQQAIASIKRCEAFDQLSVMLSTLKAYENYFVWNPPHPPDTDQNPLDDA